MKLITASRVHELLDYPSVVDALEAGHRDGVDTLGDLLLSQPNDRGSSDHLLIRGAWQRGRALGAKLASVFPGNHADPAGLPAIHGVYVLFDGRNGTPAACIDGTAVTWWKTAADSALGTRYLARENVERMLMVGAGAMAPELIRAHTAVRPSIREVRIWNRNPERARRLAETLKLPGIRVEVTMDLEASAQNADLISCATMSPTPVIHGAWLKPGTHLDLVGAFTREMRETDDEAMRRASVFVDSRASTLEDIGELAIPLASGVITEDDVLADLFDLCNATHPGRRSDEEITLYKNGGGGHLDLMTARYIVECDRSREP